MCAFCDHFRGHSVGWVRGSHFSIDAGACSQQAKAMVVIEDKTF